MGNETVVSWSGDADVSCWERNLQSGMTISVTSTACAAKKSLPCSLHWSWNSSPDGRKTPVPRSTFPPTWYAYVSEDNVEVGHVFAVQTFYTPARGTPEVATSSIDTFFQRREARYRIVIRSYIVHSVCSGRVAIVRKVYTQKPLRRAGLKPTQQYGNVQGKFELRATLYY